MNDYLKKITDRLMRDHMERLEKRLFSSINANWGDATDADTIVEDLNLLYDAKVVPLLLAFRHGRWCRLVEHHGRKRERPFPNKAWKQKRNQKRAWAMDPSLIPAPPPPRVYGLPPPAPHKIKWRFEHPRIITDTP